MTIEIDPPDGFDVEVHAAYIAVCESCESWFDPKNTNQKFCTPKCSRRASQQTRRKNQKGSVNLRRRRYRWERGPHPRELHLEIQDGWYVLCNTYGVDFHYTTFEQANLAWLILTKAHAQIKRIGRTNRHQ